MSVIGSSREEWSAIAKPSDASKVRSFYFLVEFSSSRRERGPERRCGRSDWSASGHRFSSPEGSIPMAPICPRRLRAIWASRPKRRIASDSGGQPPTFSLEKLASFNRHVAEADPDRDEDVRGWISLSRRPAGRGNGHDFFGRGWDLAELLVRNGLALNCPNIRKGRYHEAQHEVRVAQVAGRAAMSSRWLECAACLDEFPSQAQPVRGIDPQHASSHSGSLLWCSLGDSRTHRSQAPHCAIGTKWLQPAVNCRSLVTGLKWTADSKPNLPREMAPARVEKN
ncbi:hypothetical protein ACVINW_004083 [Bradyrhizobium sp. USDA 4461]